MDLYKPKKRYFFFLLIILAHNTFCQNLIINGDFEQNPVYKKEYLNFQLKNIKPWDDLGPSPDYYNTFGANHFQIPHSGNAFAGIFAYKAHEYFQGILRCPLIEGEKYYFEMYVILGKHFQATCAIDDIGAYFSKEKLSKTKDDLININPQVINEKGRMLNDTVHWMKVSGTFIASGKEKYVIIGSFAPKEKREVQVVQYYMNKKKTFTNPKYSNRYAAYYFIDDLKLIQIDSLGNEIPCKCPDDTVAMSSMDTTTIRLNEPIIINNIFFTINNSELLPESYPSLDKLISLLNENPTYKIEISGHTDNTGNEQDNQVLSENRAKAVVDYLVNKGILQTRLSYKGYGSTKPIADNSTEEGRAKNRRVEFIIVIK